MTNRLHATADSDLAYIVVSPCDKFDNSVKIIIRKGSPAFLTSAISWRHGVRQDCDLEAINAVGRYLMDSECDQAAARLAFREISDWLGVMQTIAWVRRCEIDLAPDQGIQALMTT